MKSKEFSVPWYNITMTNILMCVCFFNFVALPRILRIIAPSTILIFLGAVARSVRMVQWRTPPILVLPEDLKVDPTKCASYKITATCGAKILFFVDMLMFLVVFSMLFSTTAHSRYRGAERAIRMKRRPTKTVAQKKAAKKSAAGRNGQNLKAEQFKKQRRKNLEHAFLLKID